MNIYLGCENNRGKYWRKSKLYKKAGQYIQTSWYQNPRAIYSYSPIWSYSSLKHHLNPLWNLFFEYFQPIKSCHPFTITIWLFFFLFLLRFHLVDSKFTIFFPFISSKYYLQFISINKYKSVFVLYKLLIFLLKKKRNLGLRKKILTSGLT